MAGEQDKGMEKIDGVEGQEVQRLPKSAETISAGQAEQEAADLLGGLESGEVTKEQVVAKLKEITFLVVEDDLGATDAISEALEQARGFKPDGDKKKDAGVVCVDNIADAMTTLAVMVEQQGTRNIQIIHDLNLPYSKGGSTNPGMGRRNIRRSLGFIDTWNAEHPEDKVNIKIYINSTEIEQESWERPEVIQGQGSVRDKGAVVERIKGDVKKKMSANEQ